MPKEDQLDLKQPLKKFGMEINKVRTNFEEMKKYYMVRNY